MNYWGRRIDHRLSELLDEYAVLNTDIANAEKLVARNRKKRKRVNQKIIELINHDDLVSALVHRIVDDVNKEFGKYALQHTGWGCIGQTHRIVRIGIMKGVTDFTYDEVKTMMRKVMRRMDILRVKNALPNKFGWDIRFFFEII